MSSINVVLAHREPALARNLVPSIRKQFHSIETTDSLAGIRNSVARARAQLVIVDLELVNFSELGELCREFPATAFVSTHRLADDCMWSQSLAMGAVDCCFAGDVPKILLASDRYVAIKHAQATTAA